MNPILMPIVITVICFGVAAYATHGTGQRNVGDFAAAFDALMCYGIALVVSLVAWFGWALLK